MYSQQTFFELKSELTFDIIKSAQALTQEINLSLGDAHVPAKTSLALMDVLIWHTRNDIDERELKGLYDEWCRAIEIDPEQYFEATASRGGSDQVIEYFLSKRIEPLGQFIVSFLDTLNHLYNQRLPSSYPLGRQNSYLKLDELEQLYLAFDEGATGCFTVTMALNLFMVLDLAAETRQGDALEMKYNFFSFLRQLRPVDGFVTIRAFKNYLLTTYEPMIVGTLIRAVKALQAEMVHFDDIFELTLQRAETHLTQESDIQKRVLQNFMYENYFSLVSELSDNPVEVFDEGAFTQSFMVELSRYYGYEYLTHTKLKLNVRYLQFVLRNIAKMFNERVHWYIINAPRIPHIKGPRVTDEPSSISPKMPSVPSPTKAKTSPKQANYFSFQNRSLHKNDTVKQVKINLDSRYVTSPPKLCIIFVPVSEQIHQDTNMPKKISLDLTTIDVRKKTPPPRRAQAKPAKAAFANRKIETFDTVITRLNKFK